MSIHLKFTTQIQRPVEVVCAAITDLPSMPEWFSVKEVRNISDDPVQVGTRFQVLTEFAGSERVLDYQVTDYEPCKLFAYHSDGMTPTTVRITLKPDGDGTFLTYEFSLKVPGLIAHAIKGPLRKQTIDDLARLATKLGAME